MLTENKKTVDVQKWTICPILWQWNILFKLQIKHFLTQNFDNKCWRLVFVFVLIKWLQERKGREKEYSQIALDSHICTLQDYQNYRDNDLRILPQIKPANTQLIPARANRVSLGFVGCLKKKKDREGRKEEGAHQRRKPGTSAQLWNYTTQILGELTWHLILSSF